MSRYFDLLWQRGDTGKLFDRSRETTVFPTEAVEQEAFESSRRDVESLRREEVRRLVNHVFVSPEAEAPRVVVFCSVDRNASSSWLCARVAEALVAQFALPVCALDANPWKPEMHKVLPGGLSIIEADFEGETSRQVTENLRLYTIEFLSKNGQTMLPLEKIRKRLEKLRSKFAFVLIDAPPIGEFGDAASLAQLSDGLILLVEANATKRITARKASQALQASSVRVLGTVLNNRTFPIPEKIYQKL